MHTILVWLISMVILGWECFMGWIGGRRTPVGWECVSPLRLYNKHYTLGSFSNRHSLLTLLEAGSPISGAGPGRFW